MAALSPTTFSRTCFAQYTQFTPVSPYMTFPLMSDNLRRFVIKIWSNDQGLSSTKSDPTTPFDNSHTWFAFRLVRSADETNVTFGDDLIEFQRNICASKAVQCHVNEWVIGLPVDDDGDADDIQGWLESLTQVDDVEIGVFPLAKYPGWVNNVWKMEIEMYLDDGKRYRCPPSPISYSIDDRAYITFIRRRTKQRLSMTKLPQKEEVAKVMQLAIDTLGEESSNGAHHHSESFWRSLELTVTLIDSVQVLKSFINALKLEVESTPEDYRYHFPYSVGVANIGCQGSGGCEGPSSVGNIANSPQHIGHEHIGIQNILAMSKRGGKVDILANSLFMRFMISTEDANDINQAIDFWTTAANTKQRFEHGYRKRLDWLANCYVERARVFNSAEDLDRAVELTEKALHGTAPTDPESDYADFLMNLAFRLHRRYDNSNSATDLDRAFETAERALRLTPEHHWSRPYYLRSYGELLSSKFKRSGLIEDIQCALEVFIMASDITPDTHQYKAVLLGNIGECLQKLYDITGSVNYLNTSVESYNASISIISTKKHPLYVDNLNQWGMLLSKRHEHTGSMADIDQSIEVLRMAMDRPLEDTVTKFKRVGVAINLATSLLLRYVRTGSGDDIYEGVSLMDRLIPSIPHGHEAYPQCMSILGLLLSKRFELIGSTGDLEKAIELLKAAVQSMPMDHLRYPLQLNNLANGLFLRFEQTNSINDLDEAVETLNDALAALPQNHPERALVLWNLTKCYSKRGVHGIDNQRRCALEGWNCLNAPSYIRISLASTAAGLLNLESRWEESHEILERAVSLLPSMSPRGLKNSDQQHILQHFSGLASLASATALNAGKSPADALRLLETGRGVMAALLVETRTDISELRQSHPELSNAFVALRDRLDSSSSRTNPRRAVKAANTLGPLQQSQEYRQLESQFNEIIAKIRTNPGFEDFLLPPKTEEFLAAASLGPIVVLNSNYWGCDAFIITPRSIEVLRLPRFIFLNLQGSIGFDSKSLEDLWKAIAKPVLDHLGFHEKPKDGKWPHIWWIPIGSLSRLPIHAAGYHSEDSSETVIDRVISSYSTSIKALLQARRRSVRKLHDIDSHKACLVSMSTTPSQDGFDAGSLEFAEEEVQMLDSLLSPTASTILLHQPNKEDVLRHIESCTAFHFAGHGVTDPLDPSKSCLLLNDWVQNPLTVDDLTSLNLYERSPWLAYLSACSTGENQTERLQDESIHLASACQLAGFPHVVASLWKIDDECSAEAAAEVYRTIQEYGWTDESVALGVHNATRLLRSKTRGDGWTEQSEDIDNEEDYATTPPPDGESHGLERVRGPGYAVRTEGNPMIWAAYIHVGP